jgi:hypothetical protein
VGGIGVALAAVVGMLVGVARVDVIGVGVAVVPTATELPQAESVSSPPKMARARMRVSDMYNSPSNKLNYGVDSRVSVMEMVEQFVMVPLSVAGG